MSVTAQATLPPSLEEIKDWSRLDFDDLEEPFGDRNLQVRLDRACAYLHAVTGRAIDSSMPSQLVPIAQQAVQLRVEQIVIQEQQDYIETINDDSVMSFSAGGYSETRHSASSRVKTSTTGSLPDINMAPALNQAIWLLCTQRMRDYWQTTLAGTTIPAFSVTEADWANYDGLYPYSYGVGAFHMPFPDPTVWGA